jgi:hypothetical protein
MLALSRGKLAARVSLPLTALSLTTAALAGCSHGDGLAVAAPANPGGVQTATASLVASPGPAGLPDHGDTTLSSDGTFAAARDRRQSAPGASWIGARAVHDVVPASDGIADVGVWVDAPGMPGGARRP